MTEFVLIELVHLQLVRRHYIFMLTCEQGRRADKSCGGTSPFPTPPLSFPSTPLPRLTVFPVVFPFLPFPSIPSHSLKRRPPLLCLGVLRSALAPPASSGRHGHKTVFGEFHAENLDSSSNDFQELFRK